MGERKIGDRVFKAGDVLATDAIKLQIRLMKLIGPALENLPSIFAGKAQGASAEAQAKADQSAIAAIAGIFEKADPDAVVELVQDICALAMVSSDSGRSYNPIEFDHEFSGANMRHMIPAVLFILQETLGDFFTGALASGSRAMTGKA